MAKRIRDINWVVQHYGDFFQRMGVTEADLRMRYTPWSQKHPSPAATDFLWGQFNEVLLVIAKTSPTEDALYARYIEAYSTMWDFVVRKERKNGNRIHRLRLFNKLLLWCVTSTIQLEIELITTRCCTCCDSLNGTTMSLEKAIDRQYLASDQCTKLSGCSCSYGSTGIRDQQGRLILIYRP